MTFLLSCEDEIKLILNEIPEYKKVKRKKINKREVILRLKNALLEQNYPSHLVSGKITKILKDYDISSAYIRMILDSQFKSK